MRSLRALLLRIASPFSATRAERDFSDELESHLQMHTDDNIRAGMTPEQARRAAALKLGGVAQTEESQRDRRGLPPLDTLVRDVRHAFRVLIHNPGFSVAAVVVLALGIGANTAIFSVVNTVLLRPLPFPDAERVVRIWHTPPQHLFHGASTFSVSPANYFDWRARNRTFEGMAIYGPARMNLTGSGEPESVRGVAVASNYFDVLGIAPMIGRGFSAGEDEPGRDQVVMLSESFWLSHFGGRRDVLNTAIRLDGKPYTVIGVLSARNAYPFTAQLWVPLAFSAEERAVRGIHDYIVMARLKAGVSLPQAQAEMSQISAQLEKEDPTDDKGWGAVVVPLHADIVKGVGGSLILLLGAVALVLLIACANLANLLLAKTLARSREFAIRTALGASRGRVVQQVLSETILLAVAAGGVGLGVANVARDAIVSFIGSQLPRADEIAIDRPVLAFAFGLSILTGVAAGLVPAWRMTLGNVHDALKQGQARGATGAGETRTRAVLVVSEVALALVLMIGAGLLIRSLAALQRVDPGFASRGVLTMTVALPSAKYDDGQKQTQFFETVLDRIRAVPGVESAGGIDSLPLTGGSMQPVSIDGRPPVPMSEQPEVAVRSITAGYLQTVHLRLVSGRDFTASDAAQRPDVVLISESMARRFWPDENPIGKHLTLTFVPRVSREVVGIVADVKLLGLDVRDPIAALYLPLPQAPRPFLSLVARTSVPPATVAGAVTAAVRAVDAEQPILNVRPLEDVVADSLASQRFSMFLLATFAGVAVLLAAVGIYSVLAYTVRQRVRDIGIRMALGAPPANVVRSVLIEGLRPTLIGVLLGLAGGAAFGRVLATLIYGISPYDALTFGTVTLGVVAIGAVASVLPAYRATRVDPLTALRCD